MRCNITEKDLMNVDGVTFVISQAAFGSLCGVLGAWIRARYSRTTISPQPLEVAPAPKYRTCEECERIHAAVERRLEEGSRTFREVRDEISSVRHEINDGFLKLNDRLDPVIRSVAASQEVLKQHLEDHRSQNR